MERLRSDPTVYSRAGERPSGYRMNGFRLWGFSECNSKNTDAGRSGPRLAELHRKDVLRLRSRQKPSYCNLNVVWQKRLLNDRMSPGHQR
jgi:hypothetical protein